MKKLLMAKIRAMDTERCKGGVHVKKKRGPRPFNEAAEPISAGKLKIHRDGSFSIFSLHKHKWRWFRNWEVIPQSDFQRLTVRDRKRIRAFEERTGREVLVRDFDY